MVTGVRWFYILATQSRADLNLGIASDVRAIATSREAEIEFAGQEFDVVIADVYLGDSNGLTLLERFREEGFAGQAVILTGASDYDIESKAAALGARYVPKENLNVADLVSRIFKGAGTLAERPSSVRLKRISGDEVAAFLASAPDGLHSALARARTATVKAVVVECEGNRTAAARRLRMTRQQVCAILEDDEEDE